MLEEPIAVPPNAESMQPTRLSLETLTEAVEKLSPGLNLKVRRSLEGGLSGSDVMLVDCVLQGEVRLCVLKLVAPDKASDETQGDLNARESWLGRFLPEHVQSLGHLPELSTVAILSSLARDRVEDCRTLKDVLVESFPYGSKTLSAVASAYREEANHQWSAKRRVTKLFECYKAAWNEKVSDETLSQWDADGFPPTGHATLIFEDESERWPNPLAYLHFQELWPESASEVSIPWIQCHGDLNARNVLCPSYHRALGFGLHEKHLKDSAILKHVSIIDTPFTRILPFTFDMAFLCISVILAELPFHSHVDRKNALRSFRAFLDEVRSGSASQNLPLASTPAIQALREIWGQLRHTQNRMGADIEASYLVTLASASLWIALKAFRKNRREAVFALCLSSLALRATLGDQMKGLGGADFLLSSERSASPLVWSPAATQIGEHLQAAAATNSIIVVLGKEFSSFVSFTNDQKVAELRKATAEEIEKSADPEIESTLNGRLKAIGQMPTPLIFDSSVFPAIRRAVAQGATERGKRLVRILPLSTSLSAVEDREALLYLHPRGTFEDLATIALRGPERADRREKLRRTLIAKARGLQKGMTVFYVGVSSDELREYHQFLQEIWGGSLEALFIAEDSEPVKDVLEDWGITSIAGGCEDFLNACSDFATTLSEKLQFAARSGDRLIKVAGMKLDPAGDLVNDPKSVALLPIPDDEYIAISRAGWLSTETDWGRWTSLVREPREFYLGHRIQLREIHHGVPVEREIYASLFEWLKLKLEDRYPHIVMVPSRPGAGGSTAIAWLGYQAARSGVPTLHLKAGGNIGFEAVERLLALSGRSCLVVADPEDVSKDDLRGLVTRCWPSRYPVVFLTSRRLISSSYQIHGEEAPESIQLRLSQAEKEALVERLGRYCYGVDARKILRSESDSLFFLTLEAFGGERLKLKQLVTSLLTGATDSARSVISVIALFSRYAHKSSTREFLELLTGRSYRQIALEIAAFDQILILEEKGGWVCRHEELSRLILEFNLTGRNDDTDSWRYALSDFVCSLLGSFSDSVAGSGIVSDYIWDLLNPQLEADRSASEQVFGSRLLNGRDGLPTTAMRGRVFRMAAEKFPEHIPIVSHCGKFICEDEEKYAEGEGYLFRALENDKESAVLMHMVGKRYFDEIRGLLASNPAATRANDIQDRISALEVSAHEWFDRARAAAIGSEYNYVTAMQLNMALIEDEFRRQKVELRQPKPEALLHERVATLLARTEQLIAEGLRYIAPQKENRAVFAQTRDKLHKLRGNLDEAIQCFRDHVNMSSGSARSAAQIELTRLLVDKGESAWLNEDQVAASKAFKQGERHIYQVLQDPARRTSNIRLWFNCARHLRNWKREQFITQLQQLHQYDPTLDSAFLLSCLYFADAIDTYSPASWQRHQEYQAESARRAANLAVRTYLREWLVRTPLDGGSELRILPHHLVGREDTTVDSDAFNRVGLDMREELTCEVKHIHSPTVGSLKIERTGFELFFKPRAQGRFFYKSDEGVTRVKCFVTFTYEKPIAYGVTKITQS